MKTNKITHNTSVDALIAVTKRLMRYEDRYNMASEEFYNQFCKGQAEDSEDFIEWANTYQHFIALRRDLESKDQEGHIKSVVLDYSTYKKIEEILIDYGLAKAIEETAEEDTVDLETAKRVTGYDK